jgi:hypothetical protein
MWKAYLLRRMQRYEALLEEPATSEKVTAQLLAEARTGLTAIRDDPRPQETRR